MKKIVYLLFSILLLIGCNKQQSVPTSQLSEVEKAIEMNPDSAQSLLNHIIPQPSKLRDSDFAHWCMLSGKINDKISTSLLSAEEFTQAYNWYSLHGTPSEQVQILIYLARSYAADGDYEKAMVTYTNAIEIARKNKLYNSLGYVYSYMGDLYETQAMMEQAIRKYQTATTFFKNAENIKSYACALRDMGRGYARTDSIEQAIDILLKAESIATNLEDKNVKATIDNTLGNTYLIKGDYEKAKKYFSEALKQGRNKLPNYVALIELYIQSDSLSKAKELLKKIPEDNPQYEYSIKNLAYQIYKVEKDYKAALENLEECSNIVDSIVERTNKSKIINIETKYNNLKIKAKVRNLQIKQQNYILILVICIAVILLGIAGYVIYKKKVEGQLHKQESELNNLKIDFLNLSIDLNKKKELLATVIEKDEKYNQLQTEIIDLSNRYKKLQAKLIADSPLYKELLKLVNQNIPGNKSPLITKEQWKLIFKEITGIYPNLYNYIYNHCPNLSEQEAEYCCFCMYGFDTNAEAKLLNISPNSVRTKRLRLRQRLNITLPNQTTLYQYLIEKLN